MPLRIVAIFEAVRPEWAGFIHLWRRCRDFSGLGIGYSGGRVGIAFTHRLLVGDPSIPQRKITNAKIALGRLLQVKFLEVKGVKAEDRGDVKLLHHGNVGAVHHACAFDLLCQKNGFSSLLNFTRYKDHR
jgi:hypothetical protein